MMRMMTMMTRRLIRSRMMMRMMTMMIMIMLKIKVMMMIIMMIMSMRLMITTVRIKMMIMLMMRRISCMILYVIYYIISDDIQQISYKVSHIISYDNWGLAFEPAVGRRKS